MNMPLPTLSFTALRPTVPANKPGVFEGVVRIQGPAVPSGPRPARPSLNLALVLDVSGSMLGRPLQEAKRAVLAILDRLDGADRVAVLAYDSWVETVLESTPVAQARLVLEAKLATMHSGGNTALHAGWLKGAEAIAPFVGQYGLSRVLLMSDGNANSGERDPDRIAEEAARLAAAGIGTSTYGLGLNFNEELMTKLTRDGQACYAADAEELGPYFEQEFSLLAATVGRRVALTLEVLADGQAIVPDNLNDFPRHAAGWLLPNVLVGAEVWAAFSLPLPALKPGAVVELSAHINWVDTAGVAHQAHQVSRIPVKARASGKEDAWATERVREAKGARIQRQAIAEALRGDLAAARASLSNLQASSCQNAYMSGVANNLSSLLDQGNMAGFLKEGLYAATAMSSRVAGTHEDATLMAADPYGLRKVIQGKVAPTAPDVPQP